MSKLFKRDKGPSAAELREQARQDHELAMKSQMSKEDAEQWRQDIQQNQLETAMPLFQSLLNLGMSQNEANPMYKKLRGKEVERPSLMDLIGAQVQQPQQQEQQQQTPSYVGPYADQINANLAKAQEQAAMQQQQAQAASAAQAPNPAGMGQPQMPAEQQQQAQQGGMGQQQGQQSQYRVPTMADIQNTLRSFNINNHV